MARLLTQKLVSYVVSGMLLNQQYPGLERYIGPLLLASFEKMLGNESEAQAALRLYRERFGTVGMYENCIYDGTRESLSHRSAPGSRMVVATSKPRVYTVKIIQHLNPEFFFDFVHGSELDDRWANKFDLISFILSTERFDLSETSMVGDRSYEIVGARANGVRSIGVLWGFGSYEELSGAGADIVCESPPQLIKHVTWQAEAAGA